MDLILQNIILVISLICVFLILMWGIFTMARGGVYNKTMSNKLMRYRIVFQAIAIIIFLIILYVRK